MVTPFPGKTIPLAELSDAFLADHFRQVYGPDLRYVAAWGRWYHWDGHLWTADRKLMVTDCVREVCCEVAAAYIISNPGPAKSASSGKTINAVERLARADRHMAATPDQFDADPWLLNTPTCIVDLRTGIQRPHSPTDFCTKVTRVSPGPALPVPPIWTQFLETITAGDQELIAYLQRVAGYFLSGSISEHALFFLYGTGANGKSVFINTLARILGSYATVGTTEMFLATHTDRHPTELAKLMGARLVTAIETEIGRRWDETKLKMLTGGDTITARYMHQDFFDYDPQFKLLIAGNHKPGLRGVDEAIRRRLHLVPFVVTIPDEEQDAELSHKLEAEWPQILAWAIHGCLMWQRETTLIMPTAVLQSTADYLEDEDILEEWLDEMCVRHPSYSAMVKDLYDEWKSWAGSRNEFVGSCKAFSQALQDKGFKRSRTKSDRFFRGLWLKNPPNSNVPGP